MYWIESGYGFIMNEIGFVKWKRSFGIGKSWKLILEMGNKMLTLCEFQKINMRIELLYHEYWIHTFGGFTLTYRTSVVVGFKISWELSFYNRCIKIMHLEVLSLVIGGGWHGCVELSCMHYACVDWTLYVMKCYDTLYMYNC